MFIPRRSETDSIYLFGSHAYGTPTADSDFDLYVVIPDDGIRPVEAMQIIGALFIKNKRNPSTFSSAGPATFSNANYCRPSKELLPEMG
jgi:predicted nucleotidyltransferase